MAGTAGLTSTETERGAPQKGVEQDWVFAPPEETSQDWVNKHKDEFNAQGLLDHVMTTATRANQNQ